MWNTTTDMCGIDRASQFAGWEGVTPFQGSGVVVRWTQGDALGYGVDAPLARWNPGAKGATLADTSRNHLEGRNQVGRRRR